MSVQERIGKALARGQRRLPKAVLRRRHGEPPTIDGHTLDLQIYAYASLIQAARARNAGTEVRPQTIRDGFDAMVAIGSGDPVAEVSVHDRTIPGPARDIPVRLYHPPRTSGRSDAIVWFHQGGGVIGGLAILSEDADDLGAIRGLKELPSRRSPRLVKAHVERPVGLRTEAAMSLVKLWRRDAEVEEDAGGRAAAERSQRRLHRRERRVVDSEAAVRLLELLAGTDGLWIHVEGVQPCCG